MMLLLTLLASQAQALDIRVGQMWQCYSTRPPLTLVYIIGAIDEVRELPVSDPKPDRHARVVHLALVGVAEAPQATPLKIDHLPMRGNALTCRGQSYYGEDGLLPRGFHAAYDSWRAELARTGKLIWHDRPVDELALESAGIGASQ